MDLYDNDFYCMELYDELFRCMEVNPGNLNTKRRLFSTPPPRVQMSVLKNLFHCHNVMQFRMLNKLTDVNIIVLHVPHRIITRSVTIIRKTIEKMYNLSCRAIRRVHKIRSDGNRFAIKTML